MTSYDDSLGKLYKYYYWKGSRCVVYTEKRNRIFVHSLLSINVSINSTFISRSNALVLREKMLVKLFTPLQDHQNDKKVVRRCRHRYERPSIFHGNMNIQHHRAHRDRTLINICI